MKFELERAPLARVLGLMDLITTKMDFKSVSDALFFRIENKILHIRVVGEESTIQANLPVDSEDVRFLTNAPKLIHLVLHSDTETIKFEVSGENIENGLGTLKVLGNSKLTLPLRIIETYPDAINFDKCSFVEIDKTDFLESVLLCSGFVEARTQNWKEGICFSDSVMVATNSKSAIYILKELPIERAFSVRPDILKIINGMDSLAIGFLSDVNLAAFHGKIGDIPVFAGISVFAEEYPYKEYVERAKRWRREPSYFIEFDKKAFDGVLGRLKGIISNAYPFVTLKVQPPTAIFEYIIDECENLETIDCTSEDAFEIKLDVQRLKEISNLSDEKIKLQILKESNIMLMVLGEKLYCGSIMRDEI